MKIACTWSSKFFRISFFNASRFVRRFADMRIGFLIFSFSASSFCFVSVSGSRSILFSAVITGMPAAPMRFIVSRHILFFFSAVSSGSLMSRTRIIRSVQMVSSRVEWKASISVMGKRSMNPTVSVSRNFLFEISTSRVVVESVLNNALSSCAFSSVSASNS